MKRYVTLIWIVFLSACSHSPKPLTQAAAPTPQLEATWKAHERQVSALSHWQAKGRLAVTQGNKGGNASFVWQQRGQGYHIRLFGPFGQGAITISGHQGAVVLKESNGKTTRAATPEELLKKVAGWQVPLSGMLYWLKGIPLPNQPGTPQLNANGQMTTLVQNGWHLDITDYHRNNFVPLPRKLDLRNNNLKIKVVITSWKT